MTLDTVDKVLTGLIVLLIIGYVGINLVAPLPRFLVGENIVLAVAYAAGLAWLLRGSRATYPYLVALAGFNAGRVSRSVVEPTGAPGRLAAQHVPLLLVVLLVALLALYQDLRKRQ
ncbi:hypothetical protein [Pyrodictium occultum]|uniref:hypothetical protein n=1 Tax=Pyrodictium occultum TaxID=2309 RepID=UPI000A462C6E|nr:hypothetical protein [Pyrodictium occultum]